MATVRKPNVLFLFTDDQRFDTIGALGNPHIRTPNLNALVERGTVFTHGFIPGGTSGAVCMPSRAMLHTGRTLFHIRGAGEEIAPEHTTLGEAFRAAGYRTFGVGKWHNGKASFHRSFSHGAEVFFGGMADHWNAPVHHFDPTGRYASTCLYVENPWGSNRTTPRDCDHIHAGRHSTDVIADAAAEFVKQQDATAPFLAYVSFLAPHDPRTMPRRFLELYDPAAIPLPPNVRPEHAFDNGDLRGRDELLAAFPRRPEEIRRHLAEYYAMISHLDARIGDLLATLDARGLRENTIVVLAGDNGLALGQHGLMGKQSLYEHSVRVPLVFAGPGVPAGQRTDAMAYLLDIFPTLCELTGVAAPASVEGRSLGPVLRDPAARVRDMLYLAYCGLHRGVRDARHKLVEYVVNGRRSMTQLFDLQADPWEQCNLAPDPAHAVEVARLRAELLRLRDGSGDRDTRWGQQFWSAWE